MRSATFEGSSSITAQAQIHMHGSSSSSHDSSGGNHNPHSVNALQP